MPEGKILVSRHTVWQDQIDVNDHHRVLQFLVNGVKTLLNNNDPEVKKNITPAIVVYDLSKLRQESGYTHNFVSPEVASQGILGLYPINIEPAKI